LLYSSSHAVHLFAGRTNTTEYVCQLPLCCTGHVPIGRLLSPVKPQVELVFACPGATPPTESRASSNLSSVPSPTRHHGPPFNSHFCQPFGVRQAHVRDTQRTQKLCKTPGPGPGQQQGHASVRVHHASHIDCSALERIKSFEDLATCPEQSDAARHDGAMRTMGAMHRCTQ
jgi:hypothetical protein